MGRDNTARIWNSAGNNSLGKFEDFSDIPSGAAWTRDGGRLIAGDFTGKLWIWNVKDKSLVGELSTNP